MLRLWKWYQNCLAVHPVKTQVVSSGLIWGFGDVAAQSITHLTAQNRLHNQVINLFLDSCYAFQEIKILITFEKLSFYIT